MNDLQLPFGDTPTTHARTTDPDTSHAAAAAVDYAKQARQVLTVYAGGLSLTDHQAYYLAGLDGLARQRCSDLRAKGLIAWTGHKAMTPSGRLAGTCTITPEGRAALNPQNGTR
jgi:hypothetical protein